LFTQSALSERSLATCYFGAIIVVVSLIGTASPIASAQQTKKPFTVADDIGITLFRTVGEPPKSVGFSPDGDYFAVYSERGRLGLNRLEDSLRFYRTQDVADFLKHSNESQPPSPVWILNRFDKEGPIIKDWRWLPDSSGVTFLEGVVGSRHLVLADLRKRKTETLTSARETVKDYDMRDRQHYVYTTAGTTPVQKMPEEERQPAAIVGTGRSLYELIFPNEPITVQTFSAPSRLWAVVSGKRREVKENGQSLVRSVLSWRDLALSPDGQSLVAQLVVPEVPSSWETLYPPPYSSYPYSYRFLSSRGYLVQYALINLQTGSVKSLTDAPASRNTGWSEIGSPSWSTDGQAVLLPGTFLYSKEHLPSRPCVAVVDIKSNTRTCVETLKGHSGTGLEEGYHSVRSVQFIKGDKHRVRVSFWTPPGTSPGNTEYQKTADGTWQIVARSQGDSEVGPNGMEINVEEAFDRPPLLVAKEKETSQVIWDPNPQLKDIDLGQVSLYKWKDKEGRELSGLLYKPTDYTPERRYPLVIQTHSFSDSYFDPAGGFPTAMAASELAAAGIVVLQVGDGRCKYDGTPYEVPCAVSGYEAGANQLVSEGVVDAERIGIIGFSRTCIYVMEMLTTGALHLKTASITSGLMESYLQYMISDRFSDMESMIGAKPFGAGLQQWLKRSPTFNLDKVKAALLVNAEGRSNVLFMWEPYAGLRYLDKPVDLIMLNTDEHVLTNPAVRMASQGGSVDWFRFWLEDYHDPDPAKVEQYKRWDELRKLQEANEER
jgi:dipeptidyl aminopeptidase/acylaminoacyl peptidase